MNIEFKGYEENILTFEADASITQAGVPVKMVASGKVGLAANGDIFMGIVTSVRDGYAAVQTKGVATVKKTGNGAYGFSKMIASEDGTVKTSTTAGREHLLLASNNDTITFIL